MLAFSIIDMEDSEDERVNSVEGRKRPRTSMSPFLLFDNTGQLISSFGITGSVNSILAAAQVLLYQMLFNMDFVSSVDAPRIFVTSTGAVVESGFPIDVISKLEVELSLSEVVVYDSMVHSLRIHGNHVVESVCDFRDNADVCAKGF
ncbi:hypothetical protein DICVIV_02301 [Dictyocaulus viviparus]|uniref:Gamma-glutamyltranspeptidase n=1 Tax=Dictyocaulus viviparus TaxID=29172 RepID=A0A0D8Y6E4_DICVI|nr:hypothetical protein DICVIV_02301 [Dictyocaulus viviparus]